MADPTDNIFTRVPTDRGVDPKYALPKSETEQRIDVENPSNIQPHERGGERPRAYAPAPLRNPPVDDRRPPLSDGASAAQAPRVPDGQAIQPRMPPFAGGMAGPAVGNLADPGSNAGTERMADQDIYPPQQQGPTGSPSRQGEYGPAWGVTPSGGRGGRGAGAGRGRRLLGDQARTEAYDPDLDRADPRNIGVIDTSGRVNQGVYAASPMAHPEAYPPGTDQFTPADKTTTTAALQGATTYVKDQFHQGTPDQHTNEGYTALTAGAAGAPTDDVMRGVFATVDPNSQLPIKERMELATKVSYDFYMSKNMPEKANKVAAEILQYGNKSAQAYGKQALLDLKNGNRDAAIGHLQTAYGWLSDGYHADAEGNNLVIHDGQGKTIQTIPLDDKMINNLATGLATGTLYWDAVQHRAGATQTFGPPKPPPTQAVAPVPPGTSAGAPARPQGATVPAAAPASAPAGAPAAPATPAPPAPPGVTPPSNTPPPPPSAGAPAAAAPAAAAAPPAPAPAPPGGTVNFGPSGVSFSPQGQAQPAAAAPSAGTPPPPPPPPPPPAMSTTTPPTLQPGQPQPGQQPAQKPPADPDAEPPVKRGEDVIYRGSTVPMTDDIRRARDAVAQADQTYTANMKWLAQKEAQVAKMSRQDRAAAAPELAKYKDAINADHTTAVAAHNEVLRNYEADRRQNDAAERVAAQPKYHSGSDLSGEKGDIDTQLGEYVDKKSPAFTAGPLGQYPDAKSWGPVRDVITNVAAHNRNVPLAKIIDGVTVAMTPVGTDDKAASQSLNGAIGKDGSRFKRLRNDIGKNVVIQVGTGHNAVTLRMPQNSFDDIQRLKGDAFQAAVDKAKKETDKKAAQAREAGPSALVPSYARQTPEQYKADPVGAFVTESAGAFQKFGPQNWPNLVVEYGAARARQMVQDAIKKSQEEAKGKPPEQSYDLSTGLPLPSPPPGR